MDCVLFIFNSLDYFLDIIRDFDSSIYERNIIVFDRLVVYCKKLYDLLELFRPQVQY